MCSIDMEKYTYITVRKYSKNGHVDENTEKYRYIIGEKYSRDEYEDMGKYTYNYCSKIFDIFEYARMKIYYSKYSKGYRMYVGYMK